MNTKQAIAAIEKHGMCLVFPIDNSKETPSLWYHFFPKSKMRWEWDNNGDHRVANLWHLREELSRSRKVVYVKWFKGRATFFSRETFAALLKYFSDRALPLNHESEEMLRCLEENSPLSTKQLKKAVGLVGRDLESTYQKALKALWNRLLVVGFGEIDDGAFPSLAIGSTQNMFEELWSESREMDEAKMQKIVDDLFIRQPAVSKQVRRLFPS